MGFLNYLRESMEPGSLAGKPPQVQHILNYKACHAAIRYFLECHVRGTHTTFESSELIAVFPD